MLHPTFEELLEEIEATQKRIADERHRLEVLFHALKRHTTNLQQAIYEKEAGRPVGIRQTPPAACRKVERPQKLWNW
jgi:hypothetical protein